MFAAIRRASRHAIRRKKRKTSENDGHGIVSTTTAQLSGSKAEDLKELRRSRQP